METTTLPENMRKFNTVTIQAFDLLYNAFPKPIDIDTQKLGAGSPQDTIAECTLQWLATEGFIRYRPDPSRPANQFCEVQLTMKSLGLLETVPASTDFGEDPDTMIIRIRKALASGDADGMKRFLSLFFE